MPLVDIQLIEGVFSADQKRQMIEKVTDTMVAIEGEAMRGVTWVRVQEFASGAWGIGGKGLTTEDVTDMRRLTQPITVAWRSFREWTSAERDVSPTLDLELRAAARRERQRLEAELYRHPRRH